MASTTKAAYIDAKLRRTHQRAWAPATALLLFVATAVVVVWQNFRLGVLWDASYILENAHRIALGDVPYRDFPLPYAPVTFLMQAALVKLTGRVFLHHIVYAAVAGGVATVLTWRILLEVLRDSGLERLTALLLALPITVLGIYCIFPHPFYDPDCTLTILAGVLLLLYTEKSGFPPVQSFLTGVVLVVPLFVKQNTGGAFVAAVGLVLLILTATAAGRPRACGPAWVLAGMAAGLVAAAVVIHVTVGLANYRYWTVTFAASRRLPAFGEMLGVYRNGLLPCWLLAALAGYTVLRLNRRRARALDVLGTTLLALPFGAAVLGLVIEHEASDRAEWLLALWSFVLVVSLFSGIANLRRRLGMSELLPFVLIATVHGAFLSQQVWGSTYALWPMLVLLIAFTLVGVEPQVAIRGPVVALVIVISASLVVAGGYYVWSHERLDYADLSDGKLARSALPALAGLTVRGPWLPQFDELVRFAEQQIPKDDALLTVPGEDPFYYATGRRPRFRVVMFDRTINPYSAEEIAALCRTRGVRWVIAKRELQLNAALWPERQRVMELLASNYEQVEALDNYDIYRLKTSP